MNSVNQKYVRIIIIITVIMTLIMAISGCIEDNKEQELNDENKISGSTSRPIDLDLSLEGIPSLNQTIILDVTVTSLIKAPNTTTTILLPEGFEIIQGESLFWHDNISDGKVEHSTKVKSIKTGIWEIKASTISIQNKSKIGDVDSLKVIVGETTGEVLLPIKKNITVDSYQKLTQIAEEEE